MPDKPADAPRLEDVLRVLEGRFPEAVAGRDFAKGELTIRVRTESLTDVLRFLQAEQGFAALQDMIGLDRGPETAAGSKRFAVLYQVYRPADRLRLRVAVETEESEALPSAVSIWKSADWAEREIFDMFGLRFSGHPGLKRIYLDEAFEGHPLRKDFPLGGRGDGF